MYPMHPSALCALIHIGELHEDANIVPWHTVIYSDSCSKIRFGRKATEMIEIDELEPPTLNFKFELTDLGVVDGRRSGVEKNK